MKELLIIRGIPGSGKSTLANNYALEKGYVHVEADMYFLTADSNYAFDSNKVRDAHAWCKKFASIIMSQNHDIVISNTFTRKWEYEDYLILAKKYGYNVTIIVANGVYKNVHDVSNEIVQRMIDRFEE